MRLNPVSLQLPSWLDAWLAEGERGGRDAEARMGMVVELARRNVAEGTGGPFAAGVFDAASGRLIAPGVNLVTTLNCSLAHAEMVAMALAQRALGTYDLSAPGLPLCELVTSTEPCAMCLGAIPWSGVRRVVCGARDEDARAIGFDEGEKPRGWVGALERRGIAVILGVRCAEAREVLRQYAEAGGMIYNARSAAKSESRNPKSETK